MREKPKPQGLKLLVPLETLLLTGLANGREPVELSPGDLDLAEVHVPLRTVPVEAQNVAASAVPALPNGTKRHNRELALKIRILCSQSEMLVRFSWAIARLVHLVKRLVSRNGPIEVDELHYRIYLALPVIREVVGSDAWVCPVVASGLHSLLYTHLVVHGDGVGIGGDLISERLVESSAQFFLILYPPLRGFRIEVVGKRAKNGSGQLPELTRCH